MNCCRSSPCHFHRKNTGLNVQLRAASRKASFQSLKKCGQMQSSWVSHSKQNESDTHWIREHFWIFNWRVDLRQLVTLSFLSFGLFHFMCHCHTWPLAGINALSMKRLWNNNGRSGQRPRSAGVGRKWSGGNNLSWIQWIGNCRFCGSGEGRKEEKIYARFSSFDKEKSNGPLFWLGWMIWPHTTKVKKKETNLSTWERRKPTG